MKTAFTTAENTKIYNSYQGWTGETKVIVNGKCWVLTTMKRYNGTISTHCHIVQDEGNGNYSFAVFGNDKTEEFWLNTLSKGTKATEKTIREAHYKALAEFDAKNEAGELPNAKEEYKIEIGQVIFTDWINGGDENRRAIYAIENTRFGIVYRTVSLDGSSTHSDDRIRPYSKKFGIGVYYNEGDKISQEQVNNLLLDAQLNMKMEAAKKEAEQILKEKADKEKNDYLSQFKAADRATTTNILKRHILKTYPTVSKIEIKTESYSGGSSMRVKYYAPDEIKELEAFLSSFEYGHFDGMNDIYEYNQDNESIIIENHILQQYKYVFTDWTEVEAPAQQPQQEEIKQPVINSGNFELVDYSDKAVALFGDTKSIKEELKSLGGRFNPFLNHSTGKKAGWIFPKTKKADLLKIIGCKSE